MERSSKFPYILGGIILVIIFSVVTYIIIQVTEIQFSIWRFIIALVIEMVIIAGIGFLLYFVLNRSKPGEEGSTSPKEVVHTTEALEIFKEELAKDNGIMMIVEHWNGGKMALTNPDAIEIRDTLSFTDPSGQTSDRFLAFEVVVREGKRTGMLVGCIPIDLGKDYLRKNWNQRIRWNQSMNTYSLQEKKYPLSSAKSYMERLQMKAVDLSEEGYSSSEINQMLNPFIRSQNQSTEQQNQDRKRSAIKSPEVTDVFPEYKDPEKEDGADVSDVQADIEEFRKKNK